MSSLNGGSEAPFGADRVVVAILRPANSVSFLMFGGFFAPEGGGVEAAIIFIKNKTGGFGNGGRGRGCLVLRQF